MSDAARQIDQAGTLDEEAGPLLDQAFIAKIGKLDLTTRRLLQGRQKGEKRSKKRGQSVEFADHRQYAPGDDLRFLDWSIYARLDRLMVKLFLEEEDLYVYLLLDASASMDYGRPNKFRYAQRVVAALGVIGLTKMNRVGVGAFSSELNRVFRPERGRRHLRKLLRFLEETPSDGRTDLAAACRRFALEHPRRGLVVLVSDFLDRGGYEEAIRYFVARRMDVFCLHVLSPQELDPPFAGDLKLIDAEDGEETEITVSRPLLAAYRRNLDAYIDGLRTFCHKRGARYLTVSTALPFERLVLDQLRQLRLVR
ncbi:MAG: DUF58 domain-containing protein [Planctomycetota bacterium]|nr:MAG: DUF58 domain-containing protein [Planctomycetota bacterium]